MSKYFVKLPLLPNLTKTISAAVSILALYQGTILMSKSIAQSFASINQVKEAAESSCTFKKEKKETYTDENGIEQEEVSYEEELDYDCTERKYGGQLVEGNLYFERAKKTWHSGAVVTLKGDDYTVYCRNADSAVDWFNTNTEPFNYLTVTGNFTKLEPGWGSTDVSLENCKFLLN
jgi:hypothetical protein